jgi:hypothetical protein
MALAQRIRRGVLFSLLAPWMVLTLVLDRAIAPLRRRRSGGPNTCRVLARTCDSAGRERPLLAGEVFRARPHGQKGGRENRNKTFSRL